MEDGDSSAQDGRGSKKTSTGPVRLVRRRKDGTKSTGAEESKNSSQVVTQKRSESSSLTSEVGSTQSDTQQKPSEDVYENKNTKTPIPVGGIPPVEKLFTNFLAKKMAVIEEEHRNKSTDDVEAAVAAVEEEENDGAPIKSRESITDINIVNEENNQNVVDSDPSNSEGELSVEKKSETSKSKHKKKKKKEHKKSKEKDLDPKKDRDKDDKDKDHKHKHKHKKKHKHKHKQDKHKSEIHSQSGSGSYSKSRSRSLSSDRSRDNSDSVRKCAEQLADLKERAAQNMQKDKKLDLKISIGGKEERKVETKAVDISSDSSRGRYKVRKIKNDQVKEVRKSRSQSSDLHSDNEPDRYMGPKKTKPVSSLETCSKEKGVLDKKTVRNEEKRKLPHSKSNEKGDQKLNAKNDAKSDTDSKSHERHSVRGFKEKSSYEADIKTKSNEEEKEVRQVFAGRLSKWDVRGPDPKLDSDTKSPKEEDKNTSSVASSTNTTGAEKHSKWDKPCKQISKSKLSHTSKWDIKTRIVSVIDDVHVQAEVIDDVHVQTEVIDDVHVQAEVIDDVHVQAEVIDDVHVQAKEADAPAVSEVHHSSSTDLLTNGKEEMSHVKSDCVPTQVSLVEIKLPSKPSQTDRLNYIELPETSSQHVEKPKRNFRKSAEQLAGLKERDAQNIQKDKSKRKVFDISETFEFPVKMVKPKDDNMDFELPRAAVPKVEELEKTVEKTDSTPPAEVFNVGVEDKTVPPLPKKPLLKLGIKISETSTALIQSGVKVENDPKKQNREEGEITDSEESEEESSSEEEEEDETMEDVDDGDDGELSNSESDVSKSKKSKKKKKKHKHEKRKKKKKKHKDHGGSKRKNSSPRSKTPKKRKHSRSRSRSRSISRSRSRSGSFDKQRGVWRTRSKSKERSGRSRSRSRSRGRHRSRSHERLRPGWGSRRRVGPRRSRSRSREKKSPEDLRLKIDKAKLREIAIANAYANMKTGAGPKLSMKPDELAAFKAGGKSVAELTDFCKKISEKEADDSSDDSTSNQLAGHSDDEDGPFIHHPFKVRDPGTAIVMNIRNAKQLPIMTPAEKAAASSVLRLQFPVSSGSQHRDKEEWVPVEKPKVESAPIKKVEKEKPKEVEPPPVVETLPVVAGPSLPEETPDAAKVFPDPPIDPINIGQVVSERLSAMRRLQENPNDVQATMQMYKANQAMSQWAQSKQLPGQFTGSTGANVLTVQELSGTDPRNQAWVKRDTLIRAQPVKPGIGMFLLQKMGWKQGEGLGKKKEGSVEPLMLEFKTDRKGLHAVEESGKKPNFGPVRDLSGKHPVSALVELCNKRRWGSPEFILVTEAGPDHKKNFIFKVKVNGMEYQPALASSNKKHAKAQAATVCLQEFGLIPRDSNPVVS